MSRRIRHCIGAILFKTRTGLLAREPLRGDALNRLCRLTGWCGGNNGRCTHDEPPLPMVSLPQFRSAPGWNLRADLRLSRAKKQERTLHELDDLLDNRPEYKWMPSGDAVGGDDDRVDMFTLHHFHDVPTRTTQSREQICTDCTSQQEDTFHKPHPMWLRPRCQFHSVSFLVLASEAPVP